MGEAFAIVVTVVVVLAAIALVIYSVIFISGKIVESVWIMAFNKPMYIHFYPFPKELGVYEHELLAKEFIFYTNLSDKHKKYFRHRVHCFINKYDFHAREGLIVTPDMKIKIAATWVMLTFGMRRYLTNIFKAIILYPDIFQSANGNMHKGEFNYRAGVVVFSWRHFLEGMEFTSDNLNLGLHEFAHVLHIASRKQQPGGASAVIYSDMFDKIIGYMNNVHKLRELQELNYFRDYAYTNQHEFIAVVLENFFETPHEFRRKVPALYYMVADMINYKPLVEQANRKN